MIEHRAPSADGDPLRQRARHVVLRTRDGVGKTVAERQPGRDGGRERAASSVGGPGVHTRHPELVKRRAVEEQIDHTRRLSEPARVTARDHHRPRTQREREQSGMGRGTRANRLGDHHSSDGEHEADGEHEEEDQPGEGSGSSSPCCGVVRDEESGTELLATREMADEADEVLSQAEVEERSVRGSVY